MVCFSGPLMVFYPCLCIKFSTHIVLVFADCTFIVWIKYYINFDKYLMFVYIKIHHISTCLVCIDTDWFLQVLSDMYLTQGFPHTVLPCFPEPHESKRKLNLLLLKFLYYHKSFFHNE